MSKNDFRVQLPLWSITLYVIMMILMFGAVFMVDSLFSGFESVISIEGDNILFHWYTPGMIAFIGGFILLFAFCIIFTRKVITYNRKNPDNKLNAISFLKPSEFLEDDEMLIQVTQKATRKVYVLYWFSIPLLISIMIFPFNRYMFIFLLLLLLIIQNAIYYVEIQKYLAGNYRLNEDFSDIQRLKAKENKLQKITVITTTIVLVLVCSLSIARIKHNHNLVTKKIESCFEDANWRTVTFEKNGLFGLASVKCEKNALK